MLHQYKKFLDSKLDFVFTDGHAIDSFTNQYTNKDIHMIESLIDWEAVKAADWKKEDDLDLKRRKQAEFLVLGDIPNTSILGFVVYNKNAKNRLIQTGLEDSKIHIDKKYYFVL